MTKKEALINYCLRIADSSLILGQRMAEWCTNGPTLEEDIALSNISLDLFGQSRILYEYVSELKGGDTTEDSLAFKRNEREFYNRLITERPNGNFGDTIVRNFLFDVFCYYFYTELSKSTDERLAAFAEKSLKEVTYHMRHNGEWIIRLGDGTEESHEKAQNALNNVWAYTDDMFEMDTTDELLISKGIAVDLKSFKDKWFTTVEDVINRATLIVPNDVFMHKGSNEGQHSEFLGHLLCEMQYLQRSYPEATW